MITHLYWPDNVVEKCRISIRISYLSAVNRLRVDNKKKSLKMNAERTLRNNKFWELSKTQVLNLGFIFNIASEIDKS